MSPRVIDHNSAATAREIGTGPMEVLSVEPPYLTSSFAVSRLLCKHAVKLSLYE